SDEIPRRRRAGLVRDNQSDLDPASGSHWTYNGQSFRNRTTEVLPTIWELEEFWIQCGLETTMTRTCLSNWRNLPRPRAKGSGAGPTANRLNREKEGRREGVSCCRSIPKLSDDSATKYRVALHLRRWADLCGLYLM